MKNNFKNRKKIKIILFKIEKIRKENQIFFLKFKKFKNRKQIQIYLKKI